METKQEFEKIKDYPTLTKKDLSKSFWLWTFFSHSNYNYERLQSTGVVFALSPILKKLYGGDEEKMKAALKRHLQFFNTEPAFGGPILSAVIAMEEENSNPNTPVVTEDAINGFKTGLMGPLAGIGDTLWQGTLIPILLSFTIPFAAEGNIIMGPVLFFVAHIVIMYALAYKLWMLGYETGRDGILTIMESNLLDKILTFSKTLGAIVIGALGAQFVSISTPLTFNLGEGILSIQTDVLDSLILGLLPLSFTMLTYYLLKKQFKPTTVLLILLIIGIVCGTLGILI